MHIFDLSSLTVHFDTITSSLLLVSYQWQISKERSVFYFLRFDFLFAAFYSITPVCIARGSIVIFTNRAVIIDSSIFQRVHLKIVSLFSSTSIYSWVWDLYWNPRVLRFWCLDYLIILVFSTKYLFDGTIVCSPQFEIACKSMRKVPLSKRTCAETVIIEEQQLRKTHDIVNACLRIFTTDNLL